MQRGDSKSDEVTRTKKIIQVANVTDFYWDRALGDRQLLFYRLVYPLCKGKAHYGCAL
jgi:hypothetical protein